MGIGSETLEVCGTPRGGSLLPGWGRLGVCNQMQRVVSEFGTTKQFGGCVWGGGESRGSRSFTCVKLKFPLLVGKKQKPLWMTRSTGGTSRVCLLVTFPREQTRAENRRTSRPGMWGGA